MGEEVLASLVARQLGALKGVLPCLGHLARAAPAPASVYAASSQHPYCQKASASRGVA